MPEQHTELDSTEAKRSREHLPTRGYAGLTTIYATGTAALLGWASTTGRIPRRIPLQDIALIGVASHKAARIFSRDKVLTFVRQPLTVLEDSDAPPAEVHETERTDGSQMRRAVADLLTCPFCMSPWVATGLFGVYLADRSLGRAMSGLLAAVSISDFLHTVWVDATS